MPLLIGGPVFTSHCPQCCDGVLVASNEQSRSLTHFLPQSVGVSGWFSRGPLSHMGRLYGWEKGRVTLSRRGAVDTLCDQSCPQFHCDIAFTVIAHVADSLGMSQFFSHLLAHNCFFWSQWLAMWSLVSSLSRCRLC